jgi:hypothetical protein
MLAAVAQVSTVGGRVDGVTQAHPTALQGPNRHQVTRLCHPARKHTAPSMGCVHFQQLTHACTDCFRG